VATAALPVTMHATNAPTSAHSAVKKVTTLSRGLANPILAPVTLDTLPPPPLLPYVDLLPFVIHRRPLKNSSTAHNLIYNRIISPYSPIAFKSFLHEFNLSSRYPFLIRNLESGFPIGRMPPLSHTVIIPNNPSTTPHMDAISEYLTLEVQAGRMSGPLSREEAELILRGPFFCSPLVVAVQPQQPGTPDKIRICRHLSKDSKSHLSVNSHIHKEDFPTRFDTASMVADIVSFIQSGVSFFPPPLSFDIYMALLRFVCWAIFFRRARRANFGVFACRTRYSGFMMSHVVLRTRYRSSRVWNMFMFAVCTCRMCCHSILCCCLMGCPTVP
jgi:hypothetical protein